MKKTLLFFLVFALLFCAPGCTLEPESTSGQAMSGPVLTVNVLDVGQADCILINLPDGRTMVIDAGEYHDEDKTVKKLRDKGISKIDYLIGTHPHSDHIGGMSAVIDTFEIGSMYMPKVSHTTKSFQKVLTSAKNKGLTIKAAKAGVSVIEEENLTAYFVAPNSDSYEDLNNYSAVLYLTYGGRSFIFMGDAETQSEKEIMENYTLTADFIKVGHHGSSTSSSEAFIEMLQPKYAAISVGEGNSYNHPSEKILQRLGDILVLRTDLNGDIAIQCDGKTIHVEVEES